MSHLLLGCELIGFAVGAVNAVSGSIADWVMLVVLVAVIVYGRDNPLRSDLPDRRTKEVKIVSIVIGGGGDGSTDDPRNH